MAFKTKPLIPKTGEVTQYRIEGDRDQLVGMMNMTGETFAMHWRVELLQKLDRTLLTKDAAFAYISGLEDALRAWKVIKDDPRADSKAD